MTNKTLIDTIAGTIKLKINKAVWKTIPVPYSVKSYSYKDGSGILRGINDEYTITIRAEKMHTKEECKKYPWKDCKYRVQIDIDEYNIMDDVVKSGNQYGLMAENVSQFVFSKMWTYYASTYTDDEKKNWF